MSGNLLGTKVTKINKAKFKNMQRITVEVEQLSESNEILNNTLKLCKFKTLLLRIRYKCTHKEIKDLDINRTNSK
jgi:hypothetical protein